MKILMPRPHGYCNIPRIFSFYANVGCLLASSRGTAPDIELRPSFCVVPRIRSFIVDHICDSHKILRGSISHELNSKEPSGATYMDAGISPASITADTALATEAYDGRVTIRNRNSDCVSVLIVATLFIGVR
jgi:hypothetical protein